MRIDYLLRDKVHVMNGFIKIKKCKNVVIIKKEKDDPLLLEIDLKNKTYILLNRFFREVTEKAVLSRLKKMGYVSIEKKRDSRLEVGIKK